MGKSNKDKKSDNKNVFTVSTGLAAHIALAPLLAQAIFIVAFIIFGNNLRTFGFIVLCISSMSIIAIALAMGLTLLYKSIDSKRAWIIRWISIFPIALHAIFALLAFIFQESQILAAPLVINPIFWICSFMFVFSSGVEVGFLIVSLFYTVYGVSFYLFNLKRFRIAIKQRKLELSVLAEKKAFDENKTMADKNPDKHSESKRFCYAFKKRFFHIAFVIITATALIFSPMAAYAEIEYAYLNSRFQRLNINDSEDYDFSLSLPFCTPSRVAELDEIPSVTFDELKHTPRMDGATAFFPVYSAFAQFTYTALGEYIAQDFDKYEYSTRYSYSEIQIGYKAEGQDIPLVSCNKTSQAYYNLINGDADIIFVFEPSLSQLQSAKDKGVELEFTPIGYDALCFFVSVNNRADNLSLNTVRDIYSGKISSWSEVGGKNRRIMAFTRPNGSGSQTVMESKVMQGTQINTSYKATEVRSMGGMITVANNYLNTDNALGYTFMYYSSMMVSGNSIKYLSIDGVAPTYENVQSGAYALSVPFYAITKKDRDENTQKLLDFCTGAQGQALLSRSGYVPIGA